MTGSLIVALSAVLLLAIAAIAVAKVGQSRGLWTISAVGGPIRIVGQLRIATTAQLVLVEVQGRRLLLAVGRGDIRSLQSWDTGND